MPEGAENNFDPKQEKSLTRDDGVSVVEDKPLKMPEYRQMVKKHPRYFRFHLNPSTGGLYGILLVIGLATMITAGVQAWLFNRPSEVKASTTACTWNNGGGTNIWNSSANWSCGNVPNAGNDVIFDGAVSTANITIDADATVGSWTVKGTNLPTAGDTAYTGTITSTTKNITTSDSSGGTGDFRVYAGTLTLGTPGPPGPPTGVTVTTIGNVTFGSAMTLNINWSTLSMSGTKNLDANNKTLYNLKVTENVSGATSETRSAGTVEDDSGTGTVTWSNPSNATTSDTNYATATGSATESHYLKATSFGYDIPDGKKITGIKMEAQVKSNAPPMPQDEIDNGKSRLVKAGTIQSTDRNYYANWTSSEVYMPFPQTGTTDLWGDTWIAGDGSATNDVNNTGFGFALTAFFSLNSHTASVNHIRATIYYGDAANSTITVKSDVNVTGTLTTDASQTLSIDSTKKVIQTGTTTTNNGTISGDGSLWLVDGAGAGLSVGGTVTTTVRFHTNSAGATIPDLTNGYGGNVEIYNDDTTGRTTTFASGTLDFLGNVTTITDSTGTITLQLATNNPQVNIAGNLTLDDYTSVTPSTSGGQIIFNGTAAKTISDANATKQSLGQVQITKTSGTPANNKITLASSVKVGSLVVSADNTLDLANSGYVLDIAKTGAAATVLTVNGTLTSNSSSTVKFSATNSGGNITVPVTTYNNLEFSGSETYDLAGSLTGANGVTGNILIGASAGLSMTSSNYNLDLAGNWTNSGSVSAYSSTITLNGSGAQTFAAGGTGANKYLNNITVTNASASGVTFSESMQINSTFTDNTAGSKITFVDALNYYLPVIDIHGAVGNLITITYSAGGHGHAHWNVNASQTVTFVAVDHNYASTTITANDSTDTAPGGTNTNWNFGASAPIAPTIGTPVAQSTSVIRWYFTDNAFNETGFKVYDSGDVLKATCASADLTYCDENVGVNPNVQISGRKVAAYNGTGSNASALAANVYTLANTPTAPTVDPVTDQPTQMKVVVNVNSNPAITQFAIQETEQSGGQYLQDPTGTCNGSGATCFATLGATAKWHTLAEWNGATYGTIVTGLTGNTSYTFKVKARNGDSVETAFGPTDQDTTVPAVNSVSGSLYSDLGSNKIMAVKTIKVSVNGGAPTSASTSGGDFTVTASETIDANDVLVVYVSGDSVKGSTVTKVSASGNLSGINIYQGYTIVRHEGSITEMTNTILAVADGYYGSDSDILVHVSGSDATLDQGLYILGSKTYVPGGNVTVVGNWNSAATSATFTPSTYYVDLTGTGSVTTQGTLTVPYDFYDLRLAHDTKTTTMLTTATVTNTATVYHGGTLARDGGSATDTGLSLRKSNGDPLLESGAGADPAISAAIIYQPSSSISIAGHVFAYWVYFRPDTASDIVFTLTSNITGSGILVVYNKTTSNNATLDTGGNNVQGASLNIGSSVYPTAYGTVDLANGTHDFSGNFGRTSGNGSTSNGLELATSTTTVGGDINFTGVTLATGISTITMDGSGSQSFTAGGTGVGHRPYNLTVANTSGPSNGVTFADSLTLTTGGTFKNYTDDFDVDSKLIFTSGATYNFPVINIHGTAADPIVITTTSSTVNWIVGGTPAVTYVTVDHNSAAGGTAIDATVNNTNGGGNTNWNFGPPSAPTGVTITADSVSQMTVNWSDNDSFETGYTLDISDSVTSHSCSNGSTNYPGTGIYHHDLSANSISHVVTGFSANVEYCAKVIAIGEFDDSSAGYSSPKYTWANKPGAPTVTAKSQTATNIAINNGSNPSATQFAVYNLTLGKYVRQTDGASVDSADWQTYTTWDNSGNGTDNTGLSANVNYEYQVKARNGDNVETSFNDAGANDDAYTLAYVPGIPTTTATATDGIKIVIDVNSNPAATEFAISCDNDSTFLNYSTNACGSISDSADYWRTYTNWGGASGFTDTGLGINTSHSYKVMARNGDKINTSLSDPELTSTYTWANVPTDPTLSLPSTTATDTIKAVVNVNSNPAATEFAIYNVTTNKYVQADGTFNTSAVWRTYTNWGGASGITTTGLTANTKYTFKVKARNNDASPVETALSSPGSQKYTNIEAPTGINFTEIGGNTLTFAAVGPFTNLTSDSSGLYFTTNTVGHGAGGDSCFATWSNTNLCTDTGLETSYEYSYTVQARNGDGVANTTTATDTETTNGLNAPTNVSLTVTGTTTMSVSWTDTSTVETGFKVYLSTVAADSCGIATYGAATYTVPADGNEGDTETQAISDRSINIRYCVRVSTYDVTNESPAYSVPLYTWANPMAQPSLTAQSWSAGLGNSISVVDELNSNPAATEYAIACDATGTTWLNGSDGSCGTIADTANFWKTKATWETGTVNYLKNLTADTNYSLTTRSRNGDKVAAANATASGTVMTAPAKPSGLTHTGNTTTGIAWDWSNNPVSVDGYQVVNGSDAEVGTSGTSNYDQGSLSANTQYTNGIKAYRGSVYGERTSLASAYTSIQTPTGITFDTVDVTSITVSAAGSISNLASGSSGLLFTETTGNGGGDACFSWGQTNSCADTSLTINQQYTYKVQARNGDGETTAETSTFQKYTLANAPNTPTVSGNYNETDAYYETIILAANNNPGTTEYKIYYDTDPLGAFASQIETWTAHSNGYSVSHLVPGGLTCNSTYYYKITARNGDSVETSPAVGSDPTPPCAPSNLAASDPSSAGANISWTGVAGPSATYEITWGTAVTGYGLGSTTGISGTTTSISGLSPVTNYYYRVRANNANGTGAWSGVASFATTMVLTIDAPSNIGGIEGDTQNTITWTNPNTIYFSHVHIYRSTTSGVLGDLIADNLTAETYLDTGLTNGVMYYYTLNALNTFGAVSDPPSYQLPLMPHASVAPDTEAPSAPKNLRAQNISTSSMDLLWDASSDNVRVVGYKLYNADTNIQITSSAVARCALHGLTPDTLYRFYVVAYDGAGNTSSSSNIAEPRTLKPDGDEPPIVEATPAYFILRGVPATVRAGYGFSGDLTVTVADAGGATISNYSRSIYFFSSDTESELTWNSGHRYQFTLSDAGIHSFDGADFVLSTVGAQTLTVSDGNIVGSAGLTVEESTKDTIKDLIKDIQNNETAQAAAQVAQVAVVATTAAATLPLFANLLNSIPFLFNQINYFLSVFLSWFGIKRKKRWGRVYDSSSGKGLDLALVRLFRQDDMKLVGTVATDIRGEYYFTAEPGHYMITVSKENYLFPTQIYAQDNPNGGKNSAAASTYVGQSITISRNDDMLNIDIPLDQKKGAKGEFLKSKLKVVQFFDIITLWLAKLFLPSLLIGLGMALFAVLVIPNTLNIVTAMAYGIITIVYSLAKMITIRHYSMIIDSETKQPIGGAVLSLFDSKYNTLKETKTSDEYGRVIMRAKQGSYYLKAQKPGYEFGEHISETDSDVRDREFLNMIKMRQLYHNEIIHLHKPDFVRVVIQGRKADNAGHDSKPKGEEGALKLPD